MEGFVTGDEVGDKKDLEFQKLHKSGMAFKSGARGASLTSRATPACAADWLYKCSVQKLVVVISNIEDGEVLERWQFDIEWDKTARDDSAPREKSQKATQDEIRLVIRQITATVTFLPLLEASCSFDLLIYTDRDLVVPEKWEESGPQFIANSEQVRLRSFTTTIHKVNSMVAFKIPVND
ncbi:PREDICTED: mitotic spindle assembly checkpoint protein MAD2A [Myotis brandtii]|uniref:mitotic spindle assembly checkpoint protein MAD2A n=1 Tax=Myotis brandtii TaxID=109478 RepID=UPI0007040C91|nr:PREDICTED: mitotic spindle assembly checkpoint protein MAD2A [Myotis brandtii]